MHGCQVFQHVMRRGFAAPDHAVGGRRFPAGSGIPVSRIMDLILSSTSMISQDADVAGTSPQGATCSALRDDLTVLKLFALPESSVFPL